MPSPLAGAEDEWARGISGAGLREAWLGAGSNAAKRAGVWELLAGASPLLDRCEAALFELFEHEGAVLALGEVLVPGKAGVPKPVGGLVPGYIDVRVPPAGVLVAGPVGVGEFPLYAVDGVVERVVAGVVLWVL